MREFSIGMGPKIFSHFDKEGTAYTFRILPLGGYVRMAGWGDDTTEIKTGTPASLTMNEDGLVTRINLSNKHLDNTALPMNVTSYDLEDKLEITGLVLDEQRLLLFTMTQLSLKKMAQKFASHRLMCSTKTRRFLAA